MEFSTDTNLLEENPELLNVNESIGAGYNDNGDFVIDMDNPEEMLQPQVMNAFFFHIIVTHSVTFFIGLFGNIFTVAVMLGDKNSRSATNFFLVSLAVADLLLLLLCIPLETLQYFLIQWNKNGVLCVVSRYVELLSASASVLNLCAVSLERFIVIVFPMRSRSLCTLSNCRRAIFVVWLFSILLALPVVPAKSGYSVIYRSVERNVSVTVFYCNEEASAGLSLALYKLVILFIAPALLMVICYVYVIRELWRSTRNISLLTNAKSFKTPAPQKLPSSVNKKSPDKAGACPSPGGFIKKGGVQMSNTGKMSSTVKMANTVKESESCVENKNKSPKLRSTKPNTIPFNLASTRQRTLQQSRQNRGEDAKKARKQVIKMLILVIVLFLICWGPKLILSFLWKLASAFDYDQQFTPEWYLVRVIFNLIPFVHSCFNPLIYSFMSKNFRRSMQKQLQQFCSLFGCKCFGCGPTITHSAIPLRSTRTRTLHGVDSMYSSNYCQISETRHTEIIETVSAI